MASASAVLFSKYRKWYIEDVLPKLLKQARSNDEKYNANILKEFKKDGLLDPMARLKKVDPKSLKAIEKHVGIFPTDYSKFLIEIGYGDFLCVTKEDEFFQEFIDPQKIPGIRKKFLKWLTPEMLVRAKEKYSFDRDTFIPFLAIEDDCWAFFGNSSKSNSDVYIFSHDFDGGLKNFFCYQKSFSQFLNGYFIRLHKKNPLNPDNCWRKT